MMKMTRALSLRSGGAKHPARLRQRNVHSRIGTSWMTRLQSVKLIFHLTKSHALPHVASLVFLMWQLRYEEVVGAGCFPSRGKQPSPNVSLKLALPLSRSNTCVVLARISRVGISL